MISDSITDKIGEAMKAKDEIRLSTLRLLSSALNYEKIARQHDLSEEDYRFVKREGVDNRKIICIGRQNKLDDLVENPRDKAILRTIYGFEISHNYNKTPDEEGFHRAKRRIQYYRT